MGPQRILGSDEDGVRQDRRDSRPQHADEDPARSLAESPTTTTRDANPVWDRPLSRRHNRGESVCVGAWQGRPAWLGTASGRTASNANYPFLGNRPTTNPREASGMREGAQRACM